MFFIMSISGQLPWATDPLVNTRETTQPGADRWCWAWIPYVNDRNNSQPFMVGTGVEIGLIPPKSSRRLHRNPHFVLQTVNCSNIKTFSQRLLELNLQNIPVDIRGRQCDRSHSWS